MQSGWRVDEWPGTYYRWRSSFISDPGIKESFFRSCRFWVAGANSISYAVSGGNVSCFVYGGPIGHSFTDEGPARHQIFQVIFTVDTICYITKPSALPLCFQFIKISKKVQWDRVCQFRLLYPVRDIQASAYARYRLSTGTTRLGTYIGINHASGQRLGNTLTYDRFLRHIWR